MRSRFASLVALGAALIVATPLAATVVTFEGEGGASAGQKDNPYISTGLKFTIESSPGIHYIFDPSVMPIEGANNGSVFYGINDSRLLLTRVDGSAFTLNSVDLGLSFFTADTGNVTITGDFLTGVFVTRTVSLTRAFQTVSLDGFVGVRQVIFSQPSTSGPFGRGYLGVDNIVYNEAVGAAVPEPATWVMMFAGFGLVGFAARRRRYQDPIASQHLG